MRPIAGILILLIGVTLPMAMLIHLNRLMSRKPPPAPRQVGLLLALNGVLPVSLITLGMGLLSARLWELPALRAAMIASSAAAIILLLLLAWMGQATRKEAHKDG